MQRYGSHDNILSSFLSELCITYYQSSTYIVYASGIFLPSDTQSHIPRWPRKPGLLCGGWLRKNDERNNVVSLMAGQFQHGYECSTLSSLSLCVPPFLAMMFLLHSSTFTCPPPIFPSPLLLYTILTGTTPTPSPYSIMLTAREAGESLDSKETRSLRSRGVKRR